MNVTFIIPGPPVGKARPRMRIMEVHGKDIPTSYNTSKNNAYENLVKMGFRQVSLGTPPSERPISMIITAYFPIPKSSTKRFQAECANEDYPVVKKPDWDNIGKIISDALNEIAYKDDAQVHNVVVKKIYSYNPRTVVTIRDELKLEF